jgi:hypothetical protein
MYLQEIIEVAIGMVFVWFMVSLTVMAAQEWIAAKLEWRSTELETALKRMLEDPDFDQKAANFWDLFKRKKKVPSTEETSAESNSIYANFKNSPLIKSLSKKGEKPSYISASKFATVVLDTVISAGTNDSDDQNPTQKIEETLDALAKGATAVKEKNEKIGQALVSLVGNVQGFAKDKEEALAAARTNLETYYNDYMDRLAGVYKRRAHLWAFWIGLVIAIAVNIDSINIMQHLWREPTLRQSIVAQAQSSVNQGSSTTETINVSDLQGKLSGLSIPIGWVRVTDIGKCSYFPSTDITDEDRFGWFIPKVVCFSPSSEADAKSSSLFTWLVGVLITGAATAQGAPFWFQILGKLVNMRSTGVKPEEKE